MYDLYRLDAAANPPPPRMVPRISRHIRNSGHHPESSMVVTRQQGVSLRKRAPVLLADRSIAKVYG